MREDKLASIKQTPEAKNSPFNTAIEAIITLRSTVNKQSVIDIPTSLSKCTLLSPKPANRWVISCSFTWERTVAEVNATAGF